MPKAPHNIAASVRARLLNLSREGGLLFDLLLTRYVLERLLYRLSTTAHRERFALKGAMLLTTWFNDPLRPTRDLDLLGFGDPDPEAMISVFRDICGVDCDDGVVFDQDSLTVDRNRDDLEYGGLRLKMNATLENARVRVLIDIGFGDATEPGLAELDLPVLLDLPAPHLRAYPMETVIAEKFQAMVMLGRANSRMKDLYDIWVLLRAYTFDDDRLARAIAATFARRKTAIPDALPDALTPAFADDPAKQRQWTAFVHDLANQPASLHGVISDLAAFLMTHAEAAKVIKW
jgi:predicted nucleotidyltransferase component of viral defense system